LKRPFVFGQPLRILVNSAGIMACPSPRDSQGYESQFATNHPGRFQLGVRLWPAAQLSWGVTNTSVVVMRSGQVGRRMSGRLRTV